MKTTIATTLTRLAAALGVAVLGAAGNASAILLDRGPDMVYDTVLNITWTRQAGDGVLRNWADANAWAAGLVFGGLDDWRLARQSVNNCTSGFPGNELTCRDDEIGYMYYHNLGGISGQNKTGTQTALGGEVLTGIQGFFYFSGTELSSDRALSFGFFNGFLVSAPKSGPSFAWAVRDGDVAAAAPEPGGLALLGLGVLVLGLARRQRARSLVLRSFE